MPKLRFPEFKTEAWEGKLLEDITTHVSSSLALNKIELKMDGFPVYGAEGLLGYIEDYQHDQAYISIVKDGSGVGRLNRCCAKSSILGTLACIKSKDTDEYNLDWIYYLMNTIDFSIYKKGAGIPHIYYSDYKNENIGIPKPEEQFEIASCLTTIDVVITTERRKLVTLRDHKKGLLQNLFPQEGETIPKYRFLEFEGNGEWVQTYVEDNCQVKGRIGYRGYTTEDLVNQGEGALVLGGKHIQNHLLCLKDPTFLSWEKYFESPEIMVEVGDIIFSQRGTLGDCAIIEKEIGPATINPSVVLLKNITCNPKFLYFVLIGDHIQSEVIKNTALGAIPMLSQKQIREFPFLIPDNTKEQEKIANVLSAIDDLINSQNQKIEVLQLHKKGLLQGLFPNLKEIAV